MDLPTLNPQGTRSAVSHLRDELIPVGVLGKRRPVRPGLSEVFRDVPRGSTRILNTDESAVECFGLRRWRSGIGGCSSFPPASRPIEMVAQRVNPIDRPGLEP